MAYGVRVPIAATGQVANGDIVVSGGGERINDIATGRGPAWARRGGAESQSEQVDHMPGEERSSNSFVVRIWQEQAQESATTSSTWRGWIQHAFTGKARYFHSVGDMLAFIEWYTGPLGRAEQGGEKEDV